MLLMTLDASSAAELLRTIRPEAVTDVVAELTCLAVAGGKPQAAEAAREFVGLLRKREPAGGAPEFLRQVLRKALGEQKTRELLERTDELVSRRDPFAPLRSTDPSDLAKALEGESPSVMAVVLSELPPKRSSGLLALLGEDVRLHAVRDLAAGEQAPEAVRRKVAEMVLSRTRTPSVRQEAQRSQKHRQVAILLRGLPVELRGKMVQAIVQADPETGKAVQQAMVTWEDIVQISDRSFQEALRGSDSRKLALALVGADPAIEMKIRRNLSERAGAMLDEEISLLSAPKPEEVLAAREDFVSGLRELNANNMLSFEEA